MCAELLIYIFINSFDIINVQYIPYLEMLLKFSLRGSNIDYTFECDNRIGN